MFVELTLITLVLIGLFIIIYNYHMYKLYSSNKNFIEEERKRYKNDFRMSDTITPRVPSMRGNKYELNSDGSIKAISEERSSFIAYL